MGWYKITIKQKNIRKALTGIREFSETNYQKIEKEVREQASKKLGKDTIDEISIIKIPPDDPRVLALKAKK